MSLHHPLCLSRSYCLKIVSWTLFIPIRWTDVMNLIFAQWSRWKTRAHVVDLKTWVKGFVVVVEFNKSKVYKRHLIKSNFPSTRNKEAKAVSWPHIVSFLCSSQLFHLITYRLESLSFWSSNWEIVVCCSGLQAMKFLALLPRFAAKRFLLISNLSDIPYTDVYHFNSAFSTIQILKSTRKSCIGTLGHFLVNNSARKTEIFWYEGACMYSYHGTLPKLLPTDLYTLHIVTRNYRLI